MHRENVMNKNTLVINYRHMGYKHIGVGGVENYIIGLIKLAHNNGNRIIWIHDVKTFIPPIYEDILNSDYVEKCACDIHKCHWFRHDKLRFNSDENVVIISFSAFDHVRALQLKHEYIDVKLTALYFIPHFTGSLIFPEQQFGFGKRIVQKKFSHLYAEWINSGTVLFFNSRHISAIEESYGIHVDENHRKLVPEIFNEFHFDENEVRSRYSRDEFRIISAGRLEFPHKGFVIGMLKEFVALKEKYPQITYYIVGDGPEIQMVRDELNKLPEKVSKDIHLLPPMPFEELISFYKDCNLNISAAGCATYGAKSGLLTLPVRHYVYDCEVYGYLPECKDYTTSTLPGNPVIPYIEEVIHMPESEYVKRSQDSFESYNQGFVNSNAIFEIAENAQDYIMRQRDLSFVKICDLFTKIQFAIQMIKSRLKKRN